MAPGEQGERENVVKVINATAGSHPENIKPTARGNRLHSVYFLVVEASLSAFCTCCSDLPIVRQPILIYPFIPLNYVFNAPPDWQPKMMPAVNLQMPGLSANPLNANPMNGNMGGLSANPMNQDPTGMNMNVEIGMGPQMGGGVQMNVGMQPL